MDSITKRKEAAERFAKEHHLDVTIKEFVLRHQDDVKAKESFEDFKSKGSKLFEETPDVLRKLPPLKQIEEQFSKHTYEIFLEDLTINFTIQIVEVLEEISESETRVLNILGLQVDLTHATVKGVKELLVEDDPGLVKFLSKLTKMIADEEYRTISSIIREFKGSGIIIGFYTN